MVGTVDETRLFAIILCVKACVVNKNSIVPPLAVTLAICLVILTGCGGEPAPSGDALITGEELASRLQSGTAPLILDVRTSGEYASGHIPGAVHIPLNQITRRLGELDRYRDKEIVVYCTSGPRANSAESVLRREGFERVRHLAGDITRWRREGRPTSR